MAGHRPGALGPGRGGTSPPSNASPADADQGSGAGRASAACAAPQAIVRTGPDGPSTSNAPRTEQALPRTARVLPISKVPIHWSRHTCRVHVCSAGPLPAPRVLRRPPGVSAPGNAEPSGPWPQWDSPPPATDARRRSTTNTHSFSLNRSAQDGPLAVAALPLANQLLQSSQQPTKRGGGGGGGGGATWD